ncbi:MAG: hypothetical protein LBV12_02105 [Puniceicoccales bacterium]|jgi:nucleoside phosphorylase|nr:hypothetical protein [Puniceicoccales bacterium]
MSGATLAADIPTIIVPSPYEATDLVASLEQRVKKTMEDVIIYSGQLSGKNVQLAICGMGQPHSARRIEIVLKAMAPCPSPAPIWLAGFGGGLDPALKRNDMVYLAETEAAQTPILAAMKTIPARRIEKIYTSDVVVETPAQKVAAWEKTGAPIVDMETGPFLELAKQHGRTAAVIRVISDDAEEEFPSELLGFGYDFAAGKGTPVRMAWRLATHPSDIGKLKRFLAPMPAARARLTDFVKETLKAL